MEGKACVRRGGRSTAVGQVDLDPERFTKHFLDFGKSTEALSRAVEKETGWTISSKQLDRWKKGHTKTAREDYVDAVEATFASMLGEKPDTVCIRRVPESSQLTPLLNKDQSQNILALHVASVGYAMSQVVQEALMEPDAFDEKQFYKRIKTALTEGRELCQVFESEVVGNLSTFLERHYSMDDLKKDVERAVKIIRQQGVDPYDKWLRLYAMMNKEQQLVIQQLREQIKAT